MDTEQLVTHSRARFDHAAARRVLKEKYQAKLLFAHSGGMWCAGPELLVMLATLSQDTAVVLDLYDTPVKVDPAQLRGVAMQHWQEQMNAWLLEYEELNKNR